MSEFHAEAPQAAVSERLVQGPYMAARAGFEPTNFRKKDVESTNKPPRPIFALSERSVRISSSVSGLCRLQMLRNRSIRPSHR